MTVLLDKSVITHSIRPIYLFADSQLLFWHDNDSLYAETLLEELDPALVKAAYIGASNGDNPDYYSIFTSAMNSIGVTECRMIPSDPAAADLVFLENADVILLAGGEISIGSMVMKKSGLHERVVQRYREGAILIGISAGAVQLGLSCFGEDDHTLSAVSTFELVPFIIGAHEEREQWKWLKQRVETAGPGSTGLGIPFGGGLRFDAERTITSVRYPAHEFSAIHHDVIHRLLIPSVSERVR